MCAPVGLCGCTCNQTWRKWPGICNRNLRSHSWVLLLYI